MNTESSPKKATPLKTQGTSKIVNYNRNSKKTGNPKKERHLRVVEDTYDTTGNNDRLAYIVPEKINKKEPKSQKNLISSLSLYLVRVAIVGVGLSVLAGSVLSGIEKSQKQSIVTPLTSNSNISKSDNSNSDIKLNEEILSLKKQIERLQAKYPKLESGLFIVDLQTNNYVNLNGDSTFSAASMIKIPILIAFFQDVDAGKIRLDENLTMTKDVIGGGAGGMQYQEVGTKFTALETVRLMITVSDNTATNMLIKRLGGAKALNQRFNQWGLASTVIYNPLPDLEGTNTTTPRDLTYLLAKVEKGQLVSLPSRDRVIDIMQRTITNTLLPKGLEKDATIAHKTGDIGSVLGDSGIIDMPNGKRYLATVIVKRPHNDPKGGQLIQEISALTYQHLKSNHKK